MTESILNTIKQMLGIPASDTAFDQDIIVHINSVFMVLQQLGVGPADVFSIENASTVWSDFLTNEAMYSAVKSLMYLRVRLSFDPPGTSSLQDAIKNQISEYEWRLNIQVPIPPEPVVPPEEP